MNSNADGEYQGKPRIKLPEPAMADGDIWHGDLFGRSKYAATLRNMLADETEPLVVAVNGKWGCGKSFFLQRFAKEYERQAGGGLCIYLNAWESDYLANPFLFLYSGIVQALQANPSYEAKDPQSLKEGGKFAAHVGWFLARLVTAGVVDNPHLPEGEHPVNVYARMVELTEDLKQYLSQVASNVSEKTHKPLIVCVDELDRCRPTYAIEMLERIKHLFNIPGIVFLLGLDREQLCNSIAMVYGNIDAENYLHRFFDLEFVLPEPDRETFIDGKWQEYGLNLYWKQLDSKKNVNLCVEGAACFKRVLLMFAVVHRLELREIQTALKWFAVLARSQKAGFYFFPLLAVVLIVLRLRNRQLYAKYVQCKATPAEILDYLLPRETAFSEISQKAVDCERIAFAIYSSMTWRDDANPYFQELRDIARQTAEGQQLPESLPWVIRKLGLEVLEDIIRLADQPRWHDEEGYNVQVLQLLIARLETFEWPDMR